MIDILLGMMAGIGAALTALGLFQLGTHFWRRRFFEEQLRIRLERAGYEVVDIDWHSESDADVIYRERAVHD